MVQSVTGTYERLTLPQGWTNGHPGRAVERSHPCTSDTYSSNDTPPYTDCSGLPAGFEQAADFCLGAFAESEN
jgi:hypothetical protein